MSKKHSVCSASSASRWLACPGSLWAISHAKKLGLVDDKSSIYAEEGTKCHEVAESLLRRYLERDPREKAFYDFVPSEEMLTAADFYVGKVIEEIAQFDSSPHIKIESTLTLDTDMSMFGTADCAITGHIRQQATGIILDLKYGKSRVVAEDNPQLAFYACAMRKTSMKNLQRVKVIIVQPRIKDPITEVSYSFIELMEWEKKLLNGADRALNQFIAPAKRQFNIGSHCKWCNGLPVCPAKNKKPDSSEGLEFAEEC